MLVGLHRLREYLRLLVGTYPMGSLAEGRVPAAQSRGADQADVTHFLPSHPHILSLSHSLQQGSSYNAGVQAPVTVLFLFKLSP